ncbi:MFS domain-containing protein, partial [Haematococcus lacustris]
SSREGQADSSSAGSRGPSESGALVAPPGVSPPARGFWALMRRREVWAICVAQYCQSWGMYGLLNWLPTFFKDFYHIEIADLGAYTLAPYVVQGGLGLVSGILA